MPSPFMSSEEYDERAHQLYNAGEYDDALEVLREGLTLYPNSVELHIGIGYARLAREEYAWARQSFEKALVLEPDHEDALAGMGETLLRFGQRDAAVALFRRTLALGYTDDADLMLQVGRALFREELVGESLEFFTTAAAEHPDMAEAAACVGYAEHRLGDAGSAIQSLEHALMLDAEHTEARIYLANIHYDAGDAEAALAHLEQTSPEDHWEELGIIRLIELKRSFYGLGEDDAELRAWEERLADLAGEPDDIDELLADIESRASSGEFDGEAHSQLELFGTLLGSLADRMAGGREEATGAARAGAAEEHRVTTRDGRQFAGSWEEIVGRMRDEAAAPSNGSLEEFMATEARRVYSETRQWIPTRDAESFIRGSASAGLLRIER